METNNNPRRPAYFVAPGSALIARVVWEGEGRIVGKYPGPVGKLVEVLAADVTLMTARQARERRERTYPAGADERVALARKIAARTTKILGR